MGILRTQVMPWLHYNYYNNEVNNCSFSECGSNLNVRAFLFPNYLTKGQLFTAISVCISANTLADNRMSVAYLWLSYRLKVEYINTTLASLLVNLLGDVALWMNSIGLWSGKTVTYQSKSWITRHNRYFYFSLLNGNVKTRWWWTKIKAKRKWILDLYSLSGQKNNEW